MYEGFHHSITYSDKILESSVPKVEVLLNSNIEI